MAELDVSEAHKKFELLYGYFDHRKRLKENPPLLAHYTSVRALECIVRDEEIWFSN